MSLYRAGSIGAAVRELGRYKLDLVFLQEVRWDKEGTIRAGDYNFFVWKRKIKSSIWNRIVCTLQNNINSKESTFVSDKMSYIVLRGRWCNTIVLNVHAPTEEESDGSKDSFYEELKRVFDHFLSTK